MSQALQAVALGSSLGHGSEMSETHPTAAPGTVRGQWKKKTGPRGQCTTVTATVTSPGVAATLT